MDELLGMAPDLLNRSRRNVFLDFDPIFAESQQAYIKGISHSFQRLKYWILTMNKLDGLDIGPALLTIHSTSSLKSELKLV